LPPCPNPIGEEEFIACNKMIAVQFAPAVFQWISTCEADAENGDADRFLKVNFDNDWIADNNWENLENLDDLAFNYEDRPFAYYAVSWTEEYWIIVYSFYYARDHAMKGAGCPEDEHEGDLPKVFVVAKRATSVGDDPSDLILGFATKDHEQCINDLEEGEDPNEVNALKITTDLTDNATIHPLVSSSTGSHHQYSYITKGYEDVFGLCRPFVTNLIEYGPVFHHSNVTSALSVFDWDCTPDDRCIIDMPISAVASCGNSSELYGLIDIFDPTDGLWAQRTNPNMFTQDTDLRFQRMLCGNGGGCQPPFVQDAAPWAPWTTEWGLNPLEFIHESFNEFNCECNDNPNCEMESIPETVCSYIYNPYLCDFYEISMREKFDFNNSTVPNPFQDDDNLVINFKYSAVGALASVPVTWDWELPPGFNNTVTCEGCAEMKSDIIITIEDASMDDIMNDPENFKLTATADFVECGELKDTFSMDVQLRNIIDTGDDCEKMVLEVKDAYHHDNNQYLWSFLLYGDLAVFHDNGRRVEFNTEDVINQIPIGNEDSLLVYSLEISNSAFENLVETDGEIKIPNCTYGGLSIIIYPNPATDNIRLNFQRFKSYYEFEEGLDIYFVDHNFNTVKKERIYNNQTALDTSGLENGVYYIYTILPNGERVGSKLCINRTK
jgi:hypothetical protein